MEETNSNKKYMTEFLGTFLITLVTLWTFKAYYLKEFQFFTLALVNGLVTMFCIWFGYQYSGAHFNPSLTFSKLMVSGMNFGNALIYIVLQITSSLLAALVTILLTPEGWVEKDGSILSYPKKVNIVTDFQCFVIEFFLSFFYVFAYYSTTQDQRANNNVFGFAIASVVIFGTTAFGPFTGACVNLVRVLGPHALSGDFDDLFIFVIASVSGGVFGAFYYNFFLEDAENQTTNTNPVKGTMKTQDNYCLAANIKYQLHFNTILFYKKFVILI